MQHIALWNTAFLGDAVLSVSLAHTLKKAWPSARLDFYVRKGFEELFAAQDIFHAVHGVPKKIAFTQSLALGKQLAARGYDLWVSPHRSPRSSLMAFLSRAGMRVGYSGAWHRRMAYTLLADRLFSSLDETDRLHQLAKALGIAGQPCWPELNLPPLAVDKAGAFFAALPPKPCLGLHPGSTWGTKRWTLEGFAHVAAKALEHGCRLLLFAGPGEETAVESLIKQAGLAGNTDVHNLAGKLSLGELAAFIARLDCYLSNDSGPMHIAWAQRVPLVAVFGPTTRNLGFFPRGTNSRVVENPDIDCRPCSLHGPMVCPKAHHACMQSLDPEAVWQACKELLTNV